MELEKDLDKKYKKLLKSIIRKYSGKGFMGNNESRKLSKDIGELISSGFMLLENGEFSHSFILAKNVFKESAVIVSYCDDSSGHIGGTIAFSIQLIDCLAEQSPLPLKNKILKFLEAELNNEIYFDYGDFGYMLLTVFKKLSITTIETDRYLSFLDRLSEKSENPDDNYRKKFIITDRIGLLNSIGRTEEAKKLTSQNMDIIAVRQEVVNVAINDNELQVAKGLIADGIKLAGQKKHPGIVSKWKKELLRVAILENDTQTVRDYSRYFAFDLGFSIEYYTIWKDSYELQQWKEVIENHIKTMIPAANSSEPIGDLAKIYVEEGYLDRLMALIKEQRDLKTVILYHKVLSGDYPSEILEAYLSALNITARGAASRKEYNNLAQNIKVIVKDIPEGKDEILALINKFIDDYKHRPAMVEELNYLIQALEW